MSDENDSTDALESFARPVIGLGSMDDGDTVDVRVRSNPESFHSQEFDADGIEFDADLLDATCEFTNQEGETTAEPGDEVNIRSHSQRFARALLSHREAECGGSVLGEELTIAKSGTDMDVQYAVRSADDGGE